MTSTEKSVLIQRGLRFAVTGLFVTALHALVAVLFAVAFAVPLVATRNRFGSR